MEITVDAEISWTPVLDATGSPYKYPNPFSRFIRQKYSGPVIYRWIVISGDTRAVEMIYIGEAENLGRRVQRVRTPPKTDKGGETNKRLHRAFEGKLDIGCQVTLEVAHFDRLSLNGVSLLKDAMYDQFKRKAMENLLISTERNTGTKVLNAYTPEEFRMLNDRLSQMSNEERNQVMHRIQLIVSGSESRGGTEDQ